MKKIPIIYIIGSGHCGSTLLDLIMGSHSRIFGTGELFQYYRNQRRNNYCTCGELLKNCQFWKKVFKNINYKILDVYRNTFDFLLDKENFYWQKQKIKLDDFIKANEKIYRNIIRYSKKNIIFDSSKNPNRADVLFRIKNLDIVLIHLVRDGKGVTWSWHKIYGDYFKHMKGWFKTNIKIEIIKRRARSKGIKCIFVKYEDFVQNHVKIIKKVLKEVNLNFEPGMLKFRNKIHHQPGGNTKLRLEEKTQKIRLDDEYKTKMPIFYKLVFNVFFGWLNIFYKIKKQILYDKK